MGVAVARAAIAAGHEVTLLLGAGATAEPPEGCRTVRFTSVEDLRQALDEHFGKCDALVMSAAVGDFRPERRSDGKLARADGPVTLRLLPTEDLLAALAAKKRPGQKVIAFAVEAGAPEAAEAKARAEMAAKGADFVVVNAPAAMGSEASEACILSVGGVALPWACRSKEELASEILRLLTGEE